MTLEHGMRSEPPGLVDSMDDFGQISSWLSTYKARLPLARGDEREALANDVHRWDSRLRERRADLA